MKTETGIRNKEKEKNQGLKIINKEGGNRRKKPRRSEKDAGKELELHGIMAFPALFAQPVLPF